MSIIFCRLSDVRFAIQEHAIKQRLMQPTTQSAIPAPMTNRGTVCLSGEKRLLGHKNRCRLTPEAVKEIRRRQYERSDVLAGVFGVHPSTIARIKRGELWTDV